MSLRDLIEQKYNQLKADLPNGFDIGTPKYKRIFTLDRRVEMMPLESPLKLSLLDGYKKEYTNGTIYCWENVDPYEIHGLIREKYNAMGGHQVLGYGYTDETNTDFAPGKFNNFLAGTIFYDANRNQTTFVAFDLIQFWSQLKKADKRALGFPITDTIELTGTGCKYNIFEGGVIYNSPNQSTRLLLSRDFVIVSNTSPVESNIRFYHSVPDRDLNATTFPLLTAFELVRLRSMRTLFWPLPAGVGRVAVTCNGNFPVSRPLDPFSNKRQVGNHEHIEFSADPRITIINTTTTPVNVWIYNSGVPAIIALPLGIFSLAGGSQQYMIPDDVGSVVVSFQGVLNPSPILRGGISVFAPPTISIDNTRSGARSVTVRLYDAADLLCWEPRQLIIPAAANAITPVPIVPSAASVQVRINNRAPVLVAAGATLTI